jgi:hypothetical protein
VRALAVETHESWLKGDPLSEHGAPQGAQEGGAAARGMTGSAPDLPEPGAVLAAVKDATGPYRASAIGSPARRLRRSLTAAARGASCVSQAGTEKRRSAELRNIPREHGHPIC